MLYQISWGENARNKAAGEKKLYMDELRFFCFGLFGAYVLFVFGAVLKE